MKRTSRASRSCRMVGGEMDRLIGWTVPKFDTPFTPKQSRRHILIALSKLNRALEQLEFIPEEAGGQNCFHKPADIVESHITEARKLLHITANNLPEETEDEP